VACSQQVVALVEDRLRHWEILQYLAGEHEAKLTALHSSDIADLQARYDAAMAARETSLDDIARAMSELATSSRAPAGLGARVPVGPAASNGSTTAATPQTSAVAVADRAVWLDPADQSKCTDCGTCYQELPQLFEKTTTIIDGKATVVAQMIPGALEKVQITPELSARISRVKATCDAEIIQ
jgi:pyruvate-ferredoxin/flavodoxin oxidoreductase